MALVLGVKTFLLFNVLEIVLGYHAMTNILNYFSLTLFIHLNGS